MLDFKEFFFIENFITSTYYIHSVSLLLTLRVTPLPLLCRRNPLRRFLRLQWPLKIPPQFLLLVLLADPSLLSLRSISIACSVSGCCVACPSSHPYDQNIARVLWCVQPHIIQTRIVRLVRYKAWRPQSLLRICTRVRICVLHIHQIHEHLLTSSSTHLTSC